LVEGSEYGERCPACLGETALVARTTVEREPPTEQLEPSSSSGPEALLDNVRSAWNVGSIFRSAEGFGFRHLYLCGITPTPENEQVRKTALGAENIVPWSSHRNAIELLHELRPRGYSIWVLERTNRSERLGQALSAIREPRLVLVVGNEQAGVDPGILDLADKVVHIQMLGWKRSFNVAVAFSVAAHTISLR
jgi:tRNA G18 (ribose-2'-O)-methylase SpoU